MEQSPAGCGTHQASRKRSVLGLGSRVSLLSSSKLWMFLSFRSSGASRSEGTISDRTRTGEPRLGPAYGLWIPWF